jgi:hypothetical protein
MSDSWWGDIAGYLDEFVEAPFDIGQAIGTFAAEQMGHPSIPAGSPYEQSYNPFAGASMDPYAMNDPIGGTAVYGPSWENAGSQNMRRRRVIPRGPGSQWPGPGWRPVVLPARRGYGGRPAGDYWRRTNRMNPLNIHALRRALRRTSAATKLVKRLLKLPRHQVQLRRGAKARKR